MLALKAWEEQSYNMPQMREREPNTGSHHINKMGTHHKKKKFDFRWKIKAVMNHWVPLQNPILHCM